MSPRSAQDHTAAGRAARKRAPRNDGRRTTLRLPPELAHAVGELATLLGTTANHALILCAQRGAILYRQEVEMTRSAAKQSAAMNVALEEADAGGDFPSPEEARAAALFLRGGAD